MRVLVTGCCGFIGSNFVRQYEPKSDLILLDKLTYAAINYEKVKSYGLPIHVLDIGMSIDSWVYFLKNEKPDVIVNFCAETHVDNSLIDSTAFVNTNIVGFQNMLQGIRKSKQDVFLCHVSSDEVYGDIPLESTYKFKEDSKLNPKNPYSATKSFQDLFLQSFHNSYNLPKYCIVRPCNNFGPGQHTEKLIPKTIKNILTNKEIPIYGTGKNVREWLYVDDTANAIMKVLDLYKVNKEIDIHEIFNISSGLFINNLDLVILIYTILGKNNKDLIKFVEDRPGHDKKYAIDSTKANKILQWEAKIGLVEGIQKILESI